VASAAARVAAGEVASAGVASAVVGLGANRNFHYNQMLEEKIAEIKQTCVLMILSVRCRRATVISTGRPPSSKVDALMQVLRSL
jgi:hypothetical protein